TLHTSHNTYPLSLHDALPIFLLIAPIMWASHALFLGRLLCGRTLDWGAQARHDHKVSWSAAFGQFWPHTLLGLAPVLLLAIAARSEEHTSELQSPCNLVCRLL